MRIHSIITVIVSALLSALVVSGHAAVKTNAAPDFAFPAKVSAQSLTNLNKALDRNDGPEAVRSLMDYALARMAVDTDSLPTVLSRIDSVRRVLRDDCALAMVDLIESRVYSDVYNADKWTYDRRTLPLTPLPANPLEWSGTQFKQRILSLSRSALKHPEALKREALKKYASSINADRLTYIYYPTLFDFVASYVAQLNGADVDAGTIYYAADKVLATTALPTPRDSVAQFVSDTYASLIAANPRQGAPAVNARLNYFDYLTSHADLSGDDDSYMQDRNVTVSLLRSLYDEYKSTEYSGDILTRFADYGYGGIDTRKWLYTTVSDFIKRYPAYYNINGLRNILTSLTTPSATVSMPAMVVPKQETSLSVNLKNTGEVTLEFYSLPSNKILTDSWMSLSKSSHKLVSKITRHVDVSGPSDTTLYITAAPFATPGYYLVVPVIAGVNNAERSYPVVYCTSVATSALQLGSATLVAVNTDSGEAIEGAEVMCSDNGNNPTYSRLGLTGPGGFYDVATGKRGNYIITSGTDHYGKSLWIYSHKLTTDSEDNRVNGKVYPSLDLVRPGDSLRVAAVAYVASVNSRRVYAGEEMSLVLRDANYTPVDTITGVTDDFGRIEGTFAIPEGHLGGQWTVVLSYQKPGSSYSMRAGMGFVTVSDYKLPTFMVNVNDVMMDTPAKGDVTVTGRLMTYSGFGLGDATLSMTLNVSSGYRWYGGNAVELLTAPVAVEADGSFKAVINASEFAASPYPKGYYNALFTATSAAGETQTAKRAFALSKAYRVVANVADVIETSRPVRFDVKVVDNTGDAVEATVEYALESIGDTVPRLKGQFSTSNPVVDLTTLAVGTYDITFKATGEYAADCVEATVDDVAMYRDGVNKSPTTDVLWSPVMKAVANPGESVALTFATPDEDDALFESRGDFNVLCVVSANDSLISKHWIKASRGFNTVNVVMPDAVEARVGLYAMRGGKKGQCEYTLSSSKAMARLNIVRESFRDNLLPGDPEKWTLRVINGDSAGVRAAVMADMYNKALDAVTGHKASWSLNSPFESALFASWTNSFNNFSTSNSVSATPKYLKAVTPVEIALNTYGRSFYQMVRMYKSRMLTSMARGVAVTTESAMDEAAVEEVVDMVSVNQMPMYAAAKMADAGSVEAESEDTGASESGEAGSQQSDTEFAYRDAETPLAFFHPMMVSDDDGNVTIEFTTPNANATWSFNLLAWTEQMVTGSTQCDVLAAKPVMVQPNLPRFLRVGDKVWLKAMVMNNTDTLREVTTVVELFDPATGNAVKSPVSDVTEVAANGSHTVEVELTVPDGLTFVGYRVKASADDATGRYADGEQTAIPVLEASQPIVETQPFYLDAGQKSFELTLPEMPSDARVTLQYCANPLWYVVTALPGLSSTEPRTAVDAAVAIFSTAVARGIVRDNPLVAQAIKEWSESDRSDSTLVSMLERNSDLKTVLLQATPWMMNAANDTERMERLALLFDARRCKEAIDKAVKLLCQLQQSDGGWGWTQQYSRSSEWVTYSVLDKLGGMRRLGYSPDDSRLENMVTKALGYVDSCVVKDYTRYPKGDYMSYVTLRDLFSDVAQPSAARNVTNVTVQRMIASWRDYTISSKALAAMALHNHGFDNAAREVLASLSEYAVSDPGRGMWWPSDNGAGLSQLNTAARVLDAMAVVEPSSPDIDRVRQWLIYQKEARDWGDGPTATAVIASMLATSKSWVEPGVMPVIKVGRHKIESDDATPFLGSIRTDISSLRPSGAKLTVNRQKMDDKALTPAWGSVYEQYVASMDSIKAESCDAVSITKRVVPVNGDGEINVGDRVRVQLVITVNDAMDYVAVTDERAACLEPVDQLPGYLFSEGIGFYRENLDSSTRLFIDHLPKGTYILTYDMFVAQRGLFSSGVATIQSQYAPSRTAHSASAPLAVN